MSRTLGKKILLKSFQHFIIPIEILPGISKIANPLLETVLRINGGVELTNSIFKLILTSFAGSPSGFVTDNLVLNGISGLKLFDIFSSKAIITGFRLIMHESLNSSSVRPFSKVTLSQGSKDSLIHNARTYMIIDGPRSPAFVQTSKRAMKLGGGFISDQIDSKSISNE